MLGEERQNSILAFVEERKSVTVTELMSALGASESTIRRDLNALDAAGLLIKVHGGAISKSGGYRTLDDDVITRTALNRDDKQIIARYAAGLIQQNDVIYVDAGTTTEMMIDFITAKNVIFITNAISHAKKLSQRGYTTYILGGEFKSLTEAIVGEEALMSLDKYNFTKGFFGANGITFENGFSTPDIKEAMIKKKAMKHTKNRFVLADASKFSNISSVTFADFYDATIISCNLKDTSYKNQKNVKEVD